MSEIRNPEYPNGMTMKELIVQAEIGPCGFCGRWAEEWTDAIHDGMCPVPFMRAAEAKLSKMGALVNEQAEDDGLWFIARTAPEEYLQAALRKLHATIEGEVALAGGEEA